MQAGRAARYVAIAGLAGLLVAWLVPYVHAFLLIVRAAEVGGWAGRIAGCDTRPVTESLQEIPTRHGPVRVCVYRPAGRASQSTVLVSGVHPAGLEESRLRGLARHLAATGVVVVTPEIRDLMEYRITARATDIVEDSAVWLAARADLAPDRRIGLMGVSFSGGLAIVAAGRPALRGRLAYVFSYGGYGNLPRVLGYLCTGVEPPPAAGPPGGVTRPPHDYGVALVLLRAVDRVVPPDQADLLRRGVETFLSASALAGIDPPRAEQTFAAARSMEARMPEPAATLMRYVNTRDVAALGPRLLPHIDAIGGDPSLSPDRSAPPDAPVYLLHGAGDNVIPAVETYLLAAHLQGRTRVRMLVSGLLLHAGISEGARVLDAWPLVSFWKALLAE